MGRRFKVTIAPGQSMPNPKAVKKILNREALAYARLKKDRDKQGLMTIPYSRNIQVDNNNNITGMSNTPLTLSGNMITINTMQATMSSQAKKIIKPLDKWFDLTAEPKKCTPSSYHKDWILEGKHKSRPIVITITNDQTKVGNKYSISLTNTLLPDAQPVVFSNSHSLSGCVENFIAVATFGIPIE